VLSVLHALAAASSDAGPGPLLSSVECTSGGEATQIGAVTAGRQKSKTTPHAASWVTLALGVDRPGLQDAMT
jgi:hypothetical protein